ncbi:MAG: cysteine desulfurase [Ignavibacteria bacterium]|nr:cysteine desulfurase [Ignavibacteria bacterium]
MLMKNKVYLDYAATTPIDEEVLDVMLPYLKEKFGNASSIHQFGQVTRAAIESSRDTICKILRAKPNEIYFTSGGTEAINLALFGSANAIRKESGKNHIITSAAEHHATLEVCEKLEKSGFEVSYIHPTENGNIDVVKIENEIKPTTVLISLMHINNEVGSVNDLNQIINTCKKHSIILHIDSVQSFAKYDIDLSNLEIDLLSASSHKVFGPKGAGLLFIRQGTPIEPILYGGSQERKRRGGTENTPAIVGFSKAAEIFYKNRTENFNHVSKIKNSFMELIKSFDIDILLNSPANECSPYILNLSINPERYSINSDSLIMNLDMNGIAVSSGSACTSGVMESSHVLKAMNLPKERAERALRFSFSRYTTIEEIEKALQELKEILSKSKTK